MAEKNSAKELAETYNKLNDSIRESVINTKGLSQQEKDRLIVSDQILNNQKLIVLLEKELLEGKKDAQVLDRKSTL